ncbi:iron-siderophore ABC transporter substrate-binding protein [Vibrio pelagius]|uniref:iron-siderophore ABC transporter substrate-binding protein n=1 Tax=Vibrio pelagius TaxID=28169 RepID=UPI0021C2BBC1|nr:iron-siderophore ABC transporter substrate-binding protein [Vibrio pelagius]
MRLVSQSICLLWLAFNLLSSSLAHAAIIVHDSSGSHQFEQAPKRVVVLNWDLLEQVIALGVTPVGGPELESYRSWVVNPKAPTDITDIGSRSEPNLELIAKLKPDLILAASPQQDLLPILKQIAPVIFLPNFTENENAAESAIAHFKTIAKVLDREHQAQAQLDHIEQRFTELREKLAPYYAPNSDLVVMRFSTLNSIFLYSDNSSTQYVVSKLGFHNPIQVEPRAWGIKQTRVNTLQKIDDGYVLYVLPFPQEDKLKDSRLWQALPFVEKGHVNSVRSVWNYGGAMSLLYLAEAMTDSLLELKKTP